MATPNIETIIRDRVTLTVDCIDRLYLNGYVPTLQTSGQLCWYLKEHLGNPIPSPATQTSPKTRTPTNAATTSATSTSPTAQALSPRRSRLAPPGSCREGRPATKRRAVQPGPASYDLAATVGRGLSLPSSA